jgi:hypothetical protein
LCRSGGAVDRGGGDALCLGYLRVTNDAELTRTVLTTVAVLCGLVLARRDLGIIAVAISGWTVALRLL